ncbi:LysR family transcriptional regulator [Clostridium vitabionis]|jgi:DNA-binding transcriptional LysR family regulator|uniref:LysR family transcriptional regulator n=1 Tax=Clostridium vitabionis TaxID=2784388 RepID=UPI001889D829|nr:LysR family transcriptional regulator [Clostridium vitabionis]
MQAEMEYVYRVYQEKSFSKAAEDLFLTQPALSMAVRKVEDSLGMPIFDRSVRPMRLTPAGEAYIQFVRNTRDLEQELQQQMQDIREVNTGSVRIGGSHYINAYILPGILSAFARRHPRVKIDLVESSSAVLSQMLSRREVDITFNCNPQFMEGFERYPAFEDHILLAVPKSFKINAGLMDRCLCADDIANKRHLQPDCPCVTLDAFRSLEFILLNPGNNLRDRAKRLFEEAGFSPKVRLELSQLVTAYHLANAAMGAAFISDRLVVHSDDSLYYYKLDSGLTDRMFYMLLPNRKYTSKAVRAFVDCCAHSL